MSSGLTAILPRPLRTLIGTAFVMVLAGCSTILAQVVPSHNQSLDPAAAPSGRYVLDPEHASIVFKVDHLGFSRLVGRFNSFSAEIAYDQTRPDESRLEVAIDAASVDMNVPTLDEMLEGDDYFRAGDFPEITFRAEGVEILTEAQGRITGDMTIAGTTRPVSFDVTFNGGANNPFSGRYTLGFHGRGQLLRSEFGLKKWLPVVGDEVTFEIEAEFGHAGS